MAKRKYEFRPDKYRTDILGKLYLTPTQRMNVLRWVLHSVLLVVLSLIQDVVLCKANFFGTTTDLVPCAIILICVQLGGDRGCIFTLLAAILYKFSGSAPGYHVIALIPLLGILAAVVRQIVFRRSFSSVILCAGIATMLYELAIFAFGLLFQNTVPMRFVRFPITGALSLLSYPILYPVTKAIEKIGDRTWKD
jgi:hypothetical protein